MRLSVFKDFASRAKQVLVPLLLTGKDYDALQDLYQEEMDAKQAAVHQLKPISKDSDFYNFSQICRQCQFPFNYEDKIYSDCISNGFDGQDWCPTILEDNGNIVKDQWIACPISQCSGC